MKKIKPVLSAILLMCLFLSVPSSAFEDSNAFKLSIEVGIKNKLEEMIKRADPYAFVLVNVELKKGQSIDLPGSNITIVDEYLDLYSNKTNETYLEKIEIKVLSSLNPFPSDLENLLKESLSFSKVNILFKVEAMDKTTLQMLVHQEQKENLKEQEMISSMFFKAMLLVGIIALVLFVTLFFGSRHIGSFLRELPGGLRSLSEKFEGFREPTSLPSASSRVESSTHGNSFAPLSDRTQINDLPVEALVSLITDCYWCHLDSYAAWIWQSLNPQTKITLLSKWKFMREYAAYIRNLPTEEKNFHEDPYYLDNLPLEYTSQEDLKKWLAEGNEKVFTRLSPLRRTCLELPLEIRLKMWNQSQESLVDLRLPQQNSPRRELPMELDMGELSFEDDQLILQNPEKIPSQLRRQLHSLSWLCHLNESDREKLFQGISARELARILVGPQEVIQICEKSIGEKKMLLLKDYKNDAATSRSHQLFKELSLKAIDLFENYKREVEDEAA